MTSRQEMILRFVRLYCQRHGYGPTIREIQQQCSISSTSVVGYNLARLRQMGLLSYVDGEVRTLQIVERLETMAACPSCGSTGPFDVLIAQLRRARWQGGELRFAPAADLELLEGVPYKVHCLGCGGTFRAKPWS